MVFNDQSLRHLVWAACTCAPLDIAQPGRGCTDTEEAQVTAFELSEMTERILRLSAPYFDPWAQRCAGERVEVDFEWRAEHACLGVHFRVYHAGADDAWCYTPWMTLPRWRPGMHADMCALRAVLVHRIGDSL